MNASSYPSGRRTKLRIIRNAKGRAKKNNLAFDLSFDDIVIPEKCPLTDIVLISHHNSGHKGPRFNSPTLDRIDPALGYIKGNVRVVSSLANSLMGAVTDPDILAEAALKFSQRVHRYLDKEILNENISSRYRDEQPPTRYDSDMVSRNPRHGYRANRQLSFEWSK